MSSNTVPRRIAAQATVDTPLGALLLAATDAGLAGLWFEGQAYYPAPFDAPVDAQHPHIVTARRALAAYWDADTVSTAQALFDALPLDIGGTPFQQSVWQALRTIPCGGTVTYADIAVAIGRPSAVRAVGAAVGRNPWTIVVPCHRVIGHDGRLTGYAAGLQRKAALLKLERASSASPEQRELALQAA